MAGESQSSSSSSPPAIGIDLGTTYSCVGVWRNDRVEIIPNDQGNRITPSCVSFKESERLVGDSAINAAASNPLNTVFDAKRLIGRRFSDPLVQNDMKLWSFKVVSGEDDKPMIAINHTNDQEKRFSAEDISAMILTKMKETAESYLGSSVKDAVITVPAYFSDSQRRATKQAGTLSGLNVLRIIVEPTAAAIAYGLDGGFAGGERNVLVFDLGGGTFDVSLLAMSDGAIKVKSIAGDAHLGGEDFDNRMVGYFLQELRAKHNKDISGKAKPLRRLKKACERAKRNLSFTAHTVVEIDSLYNGVDFEGKMSRAKFEELNTDLFLKCIDGVQKCLSDASMDKASVHDVVLVGGSTRIPKVQQLLRDFFDGKELCKSIHPDEAVASGAAIQSAVLTGRCNRHKVRGLTLQDVTPLSIGVRGIADQMIVMVPRNTPFPAKKEGNFGTTCDNQTFGEVGVYEGERARASDNIRLGGIMLSGIPLGPRRAQRIDVCLDIDADGILNVSAVIATTGMKRSLAISNEAVLRAEDEVDRMLEEAQRCGPEDQRHQRRFAVRNSLDNYVYGVRHAMMTKRYIDFPAAKRIRDEIKDSIEWLNANAFAEEHVLLNKREELETNWNPFFTRR